MIAVGPAAPCQRRAPRSSFDLSGELSAAVAILSVPREAAQAMLPAGLTLAPQAVARRGEHPLLLVLGRQTDVRLGLAPAGIDYLELILAVPFVEGGPRAGPLCYLPRLFLDRWLPTVGGRLMYGFAKRRAMISTTDDSYQVRSRRRGELLLSARFRTVAPAVEAARLGPVRALFELPMISRGARRWRHSFADFELERARIQPIALQFAIERAFVPGLPVGAVAINGLADGGSWAFRLRTPWTLAAPWRSARHALGLDNRAETR